MTLLHPPRGNPSFTVHLADPYSVLGVSRDASESEIKKAYRKLSLLYHPDSGKPTKSQERFAEISRAFEILGDETAKESFNIGQFHSRYEYDQWKAQQAAKGGSAVQTQAGKGFFPINGPVEPLTRSSFRTLLKDQTKPVLIMFYADWCVHCQHFAPHYRRVGLELDESAVVSAINCGDDESICMEERIPGYPKLRLILPDKSVEEYPGMLDSSDAVIEWFRASTTVSTALLKLDTEKGLKKAINKSKVPVITILTAGAWCPPCNGLKQISKRLAERLKGRVSVATFDCDANGAFCQAQQIMGYPSIKVFPAGTVTKYTASGGVQLSIPQELMQFPQALALEVAAQVMEAILPMQQSDAGEGGSEGSIEQPAASPPSEEL